MLVLTRKLGEEVAVSGGITIVVLEVRSGQVKLGFNAPPAVIIHRREIQDRIDRVASRAAR